MPRGSVLRGLGAVVITKGVAVYLGETDDRTTGPHARVERAWAMERQVLHYSALLRFLQSARIFARIRAYCWSVNRKVLWAIMSRSLLSQLARINPEAQ